MRMGEHDSDHHGPDNPAHAPPHPSGIGSLAAALAPALVEACDRAGLHLHGLSWFRSQWQRGGGSTATALLSGPADQGAPRPVVIKMPVGPVEHRWTTMLSSDDPEAVTPRVLASGTELGGHDLAWLVLERLPGVPVAASLSPAACAEVLKSAAQWQRDAVAAAAAAGLALHAPPVQDFPHAVEHSREVCKRSDHIPDAHRWASTLKLVAKALPTLLTYWNARPINAWCHGDLHPGNALRRGEPPARCVLIDMALVHPGHWAEDALYFERVHWGRPAVLEGLSPVSALAAARRALGLPTDGDYGTLANVRRVLTAATAPALLEREGNPRYLAHALEVITRVLPQVPH